MARVLVVDDEKSLRVTLGAFIAEDGHEVRSASDVKQALEMLEARDFDVVVTDIIMPRMNGVELLRKIHERRPDIQVIMITGEPTVETASAAVRTGAFDYLSKPISQDTIQRVVGNAVRLKTLKDEKKDLEKENHRYREHLEELVEARTRELKESEEKYRTLVERANDGIYIVQKRHFSYVNEAFCRMFAYTREEIEGMDDFMALVDEDSMEFIKDKNEKLEKGMKTSHVFEFVGRKKDGKALYLSSNVSPMVYKGKPARLGIIRDVTLDKEYEKNILNVITNTSHLIQTPLTIALGQVDMVTLGLKEMSPDLLELIHQKLLAIRALVAEGLAQNRYLLTEETSDGFTPVRRRGRIKVLDL